MATNWECVKDGSVYDVWKCNSCGYEYAENCCDHGIKNEAADFKFCPNCGKKFDEWIQEECDE